MAIEANEELWLAVVPFGQDSQAGTLRFVPLSARHPVSTVDAPPGRESDCGTTATPDLAVRIGPPAWSKGRRDRAQLRGGRPQ